MIQVKEFHNLVVVEDRYNGAVAGRVMADRTEVGADHNVLEAAGDSTNR